jgi:microcystin-dependent protein
MPFARTTAPSGWLIANGDTVPNGTSTVQGVTADFTALYAEVGANFGAAGKLPDLRGIFVRGSGGPQTIDGTAYSGPFAQKQQDQLKSHTHTETNYTFGTVGMQGASAANINSATAGSPPTGPALASGLGSTLVGTETRPANISLLYCIKI